MVSRSFTDSDPNASDITTKGLIVQTPLDALLISFASTFGQMACNVNQAAKRLVALPSDLDSGKVPMIFRKARPYKNPKGPLAALLATMTPV